MHPTRTHFRLPQNWGLGSLLLATLLLCTLGPTARAQAPAVTVTDLTLDRFGAFIAQGVSENAQVGYGARTGTGGGHFAPGHANPNHAYLWHDAAKTAVDLFNPALPVNEFNTHFDDMMAYGVSGETQVGTGQFNINGVPYLHALLWHGTAESAVDLHPAGFEDSFAEAVSGGITVGTGGGEDNDGNFYANALLWTGTAGSVVNLQPAGFLSSEALGVFGRTEVGDGSLANAFGGTDVHALVWHGTAQSAVDINPIGFTDSSAAAISSLGTGRLAAIAGYGQAFDAHDNLLYTHALLWHGANRHAVDLNPAGYVTSQAFGVSGGVQVGYAVVSGSDSSHGFHAMLWRGTAASAVDLSRFLPPGFSTLCYAYGVSGSGSRYTVVGSGYGSGGTHAFLWRIVFPSTR